MNKGILYAGNTFWPCKIYENMSISAGKVSIFPEDGE